MRFFEDGPDIPETLLEARNLGEVVFFCGAGVSLPAGLPDFAKLADKLLDRLAAESSRKAREDGQSLDFVFKEMVKEFGAAAVDRELTKALRTPRNADLRYHRAAIDLSRGRDGVPKIVTTNFDLLFERAERRVRGYVPPSLPDLAQLQPINGIVYLHGRLNASTGARSGYVITSADFGRAYLAEGWAARFVRGLSERYTIVLLGYSANDPPMRYLLEGLNSRDDPGRRSLIYAFVPEGSAAAEEAWYDKGVTTIGYAPRDQSHAGLWDSLFAWADAARDPDGWRARQIALAQRQPAELRPFERGQVASLVSTGEGAQAFASAEPSPPAEWLCVLDVSSRYAKSGRMRWGEDVEIDPLDVFGLDADPPRPEPRGDGSFVPPGDDFLGWRRGDEHWPERQRLMGFSQQWTNQLPKRLYQLARWLGRVMDQPAAIWWAAGRRLPHPGIAREIDYRLKSDANLPPLVRHFWECYLNAAEAQASDNQNLRQYDVLERIKQEGWSNGALRDLEAALVPAFSISRALLSSPIPPQGTFADLGLRSLAEIEVTIPKWADGLDPPPERLTRVVAMVRRSLECMSEMILESTYILWRTPTLHPTGDRGEDFTGDREKSYLLKFRELFDALVVQNAEDARLEMERWDTHDPIFFAKLYLYAATQPQLVEPAAFARCALAMPDQIWWEAGLTREMLFALRAQWVGMSDQDRVAIEERIIRGHSQDDADEADQERTRAATAASWLRWLELNGKALSRSTSASLVTLKEVDPRWTDAWAWAADDSGGARGGYVERITESQGLEHAPVSNVVALAAELSSDDHRQLRDYRPFVGLVKDHPLRAVSALRLVARRGDYPMRFWHNIVNDWPEGVDERLVLILAHTLTSLPEKVFIELRHGIARWTSSALGPVMRRRRSLGRRAFDAIVNRYLAAAPTTFGSAIGNVRVGGVEHEKSEFSVMKSINSPGGHLARAVLDQIGKPKRQGPIPTWVGSRLARLMTLPGDGGGHAACLIARQYHWMSYWFPEWAEDELTPLFAPDQRLSEAMWHGLAMDQGIGTVAGNRIATHLTTVLCGGAPWQLDSEARRGLVALMVNLAVPRGAEPAAFGMANIRRILAAGGEEVRVEALGVLARTNPNNDLWSKLFRPFLTDAWPQQLKYQTEGTSRQLALIVERAGVHFTEAVSLALPHLRPVAHLDTLAYRLRKQGEDGQGYAVDHPVETLKLLNSLVGDNPQTAPWNLRELLELIATANPALRQSDPWRRLKAITQ
ncbi:SIR2 family protein [Novosphingobium sp. KACC 22771]|uniref:SIR2 family protein n=1 Tax=Novosphingobium sp. KACC 22771 TaxID=3025670 RepID=UPI0023655CA6|nr:SIR2 family protein [Novosphingobium sp. KACC 22771]WDF73614.1 SIR2 family protein [Novosphingobium sp. KACC 22771]